MARFTRSTTRRGLAAASLLTVGALALSACGAGASGDEDDTTLTLWHYEGSNSAMGIAWAEAIKV
ncbi:MAG TPA: carbohydrate ABC transporter substrate-binding protein, partial [Agromyces sp.]